MEIGFRMESLEAGKDFKVMNPNCKYSRGKLDTICILLLMIETWVGSYIQGPVSGQMCPHRV